MLSVSSLQLMRGTTTLIENVNLDVRTGRILAVLGRNGVGKTTLMRTLMGIHKNYTGRIRIDDCDVAGSPAHELARNGVSYVAQENGLFPRLSVSDHLQLAAAHQTVEQAGRLSGLKENFPLLESRKAQLAGSLSGGEKQVLKICCALIAVRKVLLLDEPSQGVQPNIAKLLVELIRQAANRHSFAVLVAEQNLNFALGLSHNWILLENRRIGAFGESEEGDTKADLASRLFF